MEKETNAKIIIRGKGSVKEGKVGKPLPGEDEPLHAYVTGNSMESIRKAVERIKKIIKEAVEVPTNIETESLQVFKDGFVETVHKF